MMMMAMKMMTLPKALHHSLVNISSSETRGALSPHRFVSSKMVKAGWSFNRFFSKKALFVRASFIDIARGGRTL
jgi:hypothetical protein